MSTIKTTTLSTLDGVYTVPSETLARGACRAWVNFNGTGTVAIRASFNVSSITDNGTGDYTVNFTNAMPDANYAAVAGPDWSTTGNVASARTLNYTTNSVGVRTVHATSTLFDMLIVNLAIFR